MQNENQIKSVKKGQRVFFKPEWQDKGDAEIIFVAREDSQGSNVAVTAMLGLPFNPWNYAELHMIERVEDFACAS